MVLVAYRWPHDLCPSECRFARSRNDELQISPRSRQETVIARGRPLWSADLVWSAPDARTLERLRWLIEGLAGYRGSVLLWDFNRIIPSGPLKVGPEGISGAPVQPWDDGTPFLEPNGDVTYFEVDQNPTLAADASIGATTIGLTGLWSDGSEATYFARAGSYVQFGRRLYLLAEDLYADAAGAATLRLVTGLIATAPAGTEAIFYRAACEMHLVEQSWEASRRAGEAFSSVALKFLETVTDFS